MDLLPTISQPFFDSETAFTLDQHIIVESFDDGSLLLNIHNQELVELDTHRGWIFRNLKEQYPVVEVIENYSMTFSLSHKEAAESVQTVCEMLSEAGILQLISGTWKGVSVMEKTARYIQNPDVNLREEDESGGLLFNPDTNQIQLLNQSGLFIWKLCSERHAASDIVAALKAEFTEVPDGNVEEDVEEFVSQMIDSGFLGTTDAT
jgi:hypothetical protein